MPTLNRATRGASKVGAILTALFLVAMLLPGAVLGGSAHDHSRDRGIRHLRRHRRDAAGIERVHQLLTGPAIGGTGRDIGAGTLTFTICRSVRSSSPARGRPASRAPAAARWCSGTATVVRAQRP